MKKYVMISFVNGDEFEESINAADKENAIRIADSIFDKLSDFDKKRTESEFLAYANFDENGVIDFDSIEEIKRYI